MSAAYIKLPIEEVKSADSKEKLPFEEVKTADSKEKLPIGIYKTLCQRNNYNAPTIEYLYQLYDLVDVNQIFSSAYIAKALDCSERTGRNIMAKLRQIDAVVPVSGKGKGMYRLKYKDEKM